MGMMNATNNAIRFEEKYNTANGTGSLVVKQLRRDETAADAFALIGYVHCGIDDSPVVFARGTMSDCRKAYKGARAAMQRWYGVN